MSGADVPAFLLAWADSPGPDKVLDAVRTRWEQGRLGSRAVLRVELSDVERRVVGKLLDASWPQSGAPVSVAALRQGLQANGSTLESVLVATGGPLRDLPSEQRATRLADAAERAEALAQLRALIGSPSVEDAEVDAALVRWVLRRRPPLERAAEVSRVIGALPDVGEAVLLPVLAATLTQDAHALDRSRPLGRAVARFLALRATVGSPVAAPGLAAWVDPVSSSEGWRAAWAEGGVACDTVSSQVLVLNLPLTGDAPAARFCEAVPGEPVWLSLRSLTGGVGLGAPVDVFVCENPSVVEAAAGRLGAASAPLVCTFGRPSLAAIQLLTSLAGTARLHVRADGDATGWNIVDSLTARLPGASRWRMPDGFTAFEEEIMDDLLADLALPGGTQASHT